MLAQWYPMQADHLPLVYDIADVVHPNYPERPEVFIDRLTIFPAGCFMAIDGQGQALGYAFSHPGTLLRPPPLDTELGSIGEDVDCLYLHDVALLPAARGLGLGAALVQILAQLAERQQLGPVALTAVNGSVPFWQGQGFVITDPDSALKKKLESYDADAAYMIRPQI